MRPTKCHSIYFRQVTLENVSHSVFLEMYFWIDGLKVMRLCDSFSKESVDGQTQASFLSSCVPVARELTSQERQAKKKVVLNMQKHTTFLTHRTIKIILAKKVTHIIKFSIILAWLLLWGIL